MTRGMRRDWISSSFVRALVLAVLAGCNQPDMSGYRPAGQQGRSSTAEKATGSEKTETVVESPEAAADNGSVVSQSKPSSGFSENSPNSASKPDIIADGTEKKDRPNTSLGRNGSGPSESTTSEPASAEDAVKAAASTEPRKIEVLIKERSFRTDRRTGALIVSFEDLDLEKVLNMTQVTENAEELMPEWLKGLSGKSIRIRGFMVPTFEAEGIERFVLARDNQNCCFGPNPKIDYLIQVDMKAGKTTNYIPVDRSFDVIGNFRIKLEAHEGKLFGLYSIVDAIVIDR